jgi:2-dehydropantoate 2-reductase
MKICVIGGGAMGSIYGGLMSHTGQDVGLVDTWPEHVSAIQRDGLLLQTFGQALRIRISASAEPLVLGTADVALVLTNTYSTAAAAKTAARVLKPEGYALTLQNGVGNVECLVAELGAERVLAGVSFHSGAVRAPGQVAHTHRGATTIGELDGRDSPRLRQLHAALEAAGLLPETSNEVMAFVWSKWLHNCAINPICAALGIRVGEIPLTPGAVELQDKVMAELVAVLAAKQIRIPGADPIAAIRDFCRKKFNKPSMLQHVEAGKETEIDALNGAAVRLGRELGIATPYNEALTWMVKGVAAQSALRQHGPVRDYAALERAAG